MQASPKSKGQSRAAVGLVQSIKRRSNCAAGSACATSSFTRKIDNRCDTSPATKVFCFGFDARTGGRASCLTRPAGFQPAGYAKLATASPSRGGQDACQPRQPGRYPILQAVGFPHPIALCLILLL